MAPAGHIITSRSCGGVEKLIRQNEEIVTNFSRRAPNTLQRCEKWDRSTEKQNYTHPGTSSNYSVQGAHLTPLAHRRNEPHHVQTSYCIACTNVRRNPGDRSTLSLHESLQHPRALFCGSYDGVRLAAAPDLPLTRHSPSPWTFNSNRDLVHLHPHPLGQQHFVYPQCFD